MNPEWFGDSFDIVKRFFIGNIRELGYQVYVDPMLTGDWRGLEQKFYDFLGVAPLGDFKRTVDRTALLLDPDTGVGREPTKKHVTIEKIVDLLQYYESVMSFDQSFSHGCNSIEEIRRKLRSLQAMNAVGFYYDSHARFLFSAKSMPVLMQLEQQFSELDCQKEG